MAKLEMPLREESTLVISVFSDSQCPLNSCKFSYTSLKIIVLTANLKANKLLWAHQIINTMSRSYQERKP
jgi:hypothetical protein